VIAAGGNFAIHVNNLAKAEAFYPVVPGFRLLNKTTNWLVNDMGIDKLFTVKDDIHARGSVHY
jgi:hypothetical protein